MTMFHTARRKTMTQTQRVPAPQAAMRLTPLAYAVAVLLAAGGTVQQAQAQQAFSGAWFAGKGATQATAAQTGRQPGGVPLPGRPAAPGPQAGEQLQRSLNNLHLAARAIAAQQAAQAQARQGAAGAPGAPDGLAKGGLQVDADSLTAGWLNAQAPVQTVQGGKTTVLVRQTADKAILNWETLNVGKDTTLSFQQQKDWAVLNRVNDPLARPSQIQGRIEGDGTVLLVNRNGIVFHGASQVDTRNLVAAAAGIGDAQFRERGIYSNGSAPSISDALGKVEVLRGARLAARAPANSTEGGGYVLLAGAEVHNGGEIVTPKGQALLAAGDSFVIRKGVGTDGNALSTTRGNEVVPRFEAAGATGKVANTGLIQAREGDATLAGRELRQDGVLLATTSVVARGTVHLQALGEQAAVVLGQGATTAVLIEDDAKTTALDSQRDGLRSPAVTGTASMPPLADRRDQSRIAIDSAGTVDFQGASLTLATGGQISVNAAGRSLVRDRAQIDVAGAAGVRLAMESNNVKVNVQGNEQRDAPGNRDGKGLNNSDIWLDRRGLVLVPKGANGYDSDRWYTAGGLLEVGGYLGMQGHTVGEWMAQGGTLSFGGRDVVTQAGSSINLSGGTLQVEGGSIRQTWLTGADGRQYEASRAPGDMLYTGLYRGFEELHPRWGESATASYRSPLIAPLQRLENGYTVGRDAGRLVIGTQAAVLEGLIDASAVQGPGQQQAAQAGVDGYQQSHKAAATRGQLIVGRSVPMFEKSTGLTHDSLGAVMREVQLAGGADDIAAGVDLGTLLPTARQGRLVLDTARLNGFELGAIRIAATDTIAVNGAVRVADGGSVTLYGSDVAVNADVTAHAGGIQIGNILRQAVNDRIEDSVLKTPAGGKAGVQVAGGVTLDASGLWSQSLQEEDALAGGKLAYRHGGSVSLRSSGDVLLRQDSRIDVRSGAAQLAGGAVRGGKGGNVTLETRMQGSDRAAGLAFAGALLGQGMEGGGTLQVRAAKVLIGAPALAADTLQLDSGFFDKGFARYDIGGNGGLTVADGAQVAVTMPLLRLAGQEVEAWLSPVYREDAAKGVLTQRLGASLRLQAGVADVSGGADMANVQARIGHGAVLEVDPGQSITVAGIGQLTLDGRLNAWGGKIALEGMAGDVQAGEAANGAGHGRSIWIGDGAVLDVAGRAAPAVDARGQREGLVRAGGSSGGGGTLDQATGKADAAHLFVAVREGALLDASGTQAQLDVAGLGATQVASRGGSIALASNNGLYLDGRMQAGAGGAGAAGGTLAVALETPQYRDTAGERVRHAREFMLRQQPAGGTLAATQPEQAAAQFVYGQAALAASQVAAGGFGNLSILSNGMLGFDGDLSLSLGQSLHLYAPTLVLADGAAAATRVLLAAPYMRLAGIGAVGTSDGQIRPTLTGGMSTQAAAGTLRLAAGQLLDVRDVLTTGAHGGQARSQGLPVTLDRRAFDSVELASQGDLRFLASTVNGQNTVLNTPADLSLAARRIYPATGANAIVRAGYVGGNSDFAQQRLLRIGSAGTADAPPLPPYSAFGALTLGAAAIEQGGVLLAPLGSIVLGLSTGASMSGTRSVRFLPGSVTSVSGAGLMLPYGGTADGVSWRYDGQDVSLLGAGGTYGTTANLKVGLVMTSRAVEVQPGAVLDLSGGGQLLGAAFVAGRGGSTDARYHPLVQTRASGGFILPELAGNPVYAIVPGTQAPLAPADGERGASVPVSGQQVTIGAGVPGLPAGSYTLLPSTYALLPGAFRVEINGQAGIAPAAPNAMRNGSWAASGRLSVAGTGIGDALSRQLIVTPASVLRSYSQYRETSYADFVRADAARLDVPRAMLEADARTMTVQLMPGNGDAIDFHFQGQARFQPADKGHGGTLAFPMDGGHLEVLAAAGQASADIGTVSLRAADVNAVGAARLSLGNLPVVRYGQGGKLLDFSTGRAAGAISVRDGASLSAAEVLLVANSSGATQGAGIQVEQGAAISTLGRGKSAFDADDGFVYQPGYRGVLAVSNGRLQMLAPEHDSAGTPASIRIGTCAQAACAGATSLYSEGSIAFATSSAFELGDAVRYGTRHLALAVGGINVGSAQALDAAAARAALPPGLTLNQEVLDRLLRGDAGTGAPALQTLSLTAAQSLNFYGDTTLSTMDASGKSLLEKLSLTTPAMYGSGKAGEAARIITDTLVWNGGTAGAAALPGAVLAGGAGTGSGTLDVRARHIEFGYGPDTRPDTLADAPRLILGFADVRLNASERITANHKGSLAVHQSQGAYATGKGYQYAGGDLYLNTPLLTGQAASVNRITAGGALSVAGAGGPAALTGSEALGAELLLAGHSVTLDTAVVLPSGKLSVAAERDVRLLDGAQLDLAGRKVSIHDADKYSWGGEVILSSRSGNIAQSAAAGIDVSARNNQGGRVQAIALDAAAGRVDLLGRLLGGASGRYDAGGTVLSYKGGAVDIRAQDVGDFAALNRRLNDGKVDGERSFQIKQGDLSIGDEIRAGSVNVSLDNGRLTVAGTIDASGERVGVIRLAGKQGVTLAGTAVLDAHGSVLRVDSHGKIIDAPNRALIEINAGDGVLALDSGARLDVRHGTAAASGAGKGLHDGQARGTLALHAARLGSAGGAGDADAATHG
ncbi:MAG: filamentous hemagglutinin N-terminal domain-containing protein, partial [Janthinobacterium sp.]